MLITSPHPVTTIHQLEILGAINHRHRSLMFDEKIRSRQLKEFCCLDHSVDATTFFLTNTKTTHQISQSLVSRLVTIDKTVNGNNGFTRIGNFYAISINLDHGGGTGQLEILMNERIGQQFSNHHLGNQLYFFADCIRCQPWRAKRRLVDPSSREAALFSQRALRQRENKVGLRTRRPVIGSQVRSSNELAKLLRSAW